MPENAKKLDSLLKDKGKANEDVMSSLNMIEEATRYSLRTDENMPEALIELRFEDPNINPAMLERVMSKFYAVVRYKLYHQIKRYWDQNRDKSFKPNEYS